MPYAPGSRCSDPGCGAPATSRGRCPAHQRKAWLNPSQHKLLMSSSQEKAWRRAVLLDPSTRSPRSCAHCGRAGASRADHIVPVGEGGSLYDVENGQALCVECDDEKTVEDLKRMRVKRGLRR